MGRRVWRMTEAQLMREIQIALTDDKTRLFRNNNGVLRDARGQYVKYGLAPGSSDLIGVRRITITPEMVGRIVGVFCALEVKLPTNNERPEIQLAFTRIVQDLGGRAGFCTSVSEALKILSE